MSDGPLRVWMVSQPEVDMGDRLARLSLNPIARSHLDARGSAEERVLRYGRLLEDYAFTDPGDAEVALVAWSAERAGRAEVRRQVEAAEQRGLRTLVFSTHDLEPIMPSPSIILVHPGPTRNAQPHASVLAVPYFFTDRAGGPAQLPGGDGPTVAFCGQGATRPVASALQWARRLAHASANRVRPRVVAPPVRGHVALRAEALRLLSEHPNIEERFIVRDRYRAGAGDEPERARTQAEFDDNLRSARYALCIRGSGNFSARFYEALSFGRVPLFVDTACVLPFEDEIDWRERCVWVDSSTLAQIGDRVISHHRAPDASGRCAPEVLRSLWEERLTTDGYFHHLVGSVRRLL